MTPTDTLRAPTGHHFLGRKKYYPRAYKRLFLQERDLHFFRYCLEQKFLSINQLAERFFYPKPDTKHKNQAAYRRVLILQKFGLLRIVPLPIHGPVIQVTPAGARELDIRGISHLPPATSVDLRTFEHDRRVTDVRILFDKMRLAAAWQSDRYLKSIFPHRVPDAIFVLSNGQKVALELEIARKAKDRYKNILKDYLGKSFGSIDLLFYVCHTDAQIHYLSQLTREYRWTYFTRYDELTKMKEQTIFVNQREQFALKELLTCP